eukprot:11245868-Ditylum_brightwellii.AAC.1
MALGISEDYYMHCSIYPFYGSGQGATNLPVISGIIALLGFVDDLTNQANTGDSIPIKFKSALIRAGT